MYVNIIRSCRDVVAVCDNNLLGKVFEEEGILLDVKESFYKGEEKNEQETIEVLKDMKQEDATFNLVGENTVNAALKAEVIHPEQIGEIAGIKYALILL